MKSFEFKYGNNWYLYDNGHIKKKLTFDYYDYFCPVLIDLSDKIDNFSEDQLKSILEAILHAYFYGKKEKIREFKRVLNLD